MNPVAWTSLLRRSKLVPHSGSHCLGTWGSLVLFSLTQEERKAEHHHSSPSTPEPGTPTGLVEDLAIAFLSLQCTTENSGECLVSFWHTGVSGFWSFVTELNITMQWEVCCYRVSLGDTPGSFSYFLPILFYNLIAARESKSRTRPADPCSAF